MQELPLSFPCAGKPEPLALPEGETLTLAVHSGKMHADDVLATAVLRLVAKREGKSVELIRTRNPERIAHAAVVVDVGGEYDPQRYRFDHHQPEGAGERPCGVPYAAVGLVWKHFGFSLCDGDEQLWQLLDERIVAPVDAADNGVELCEPKVASLRPLSFHTVLWSIAPSWDAPEGAEDEAFAEAVEFAEGFLQRSVVKGKKYLEGLRLAHKCFIRASDDIALLDGPYPYEDLAPAFPSIRIVVRPRRDGMWQATAAPQDPTAAVTPPVFPEAWAGLSGDALAAATGVSDAVFCHRGRWLCVARTREGALALARKAVEGA